MQPAPAAIADAWSRYAQGNFQGALDISRQLLARSPKDAAAMVCGAMSEWELGGDVARSIGQVEQAVKLAPGEGWMRHNLGTLLAAAGRLKEAQAAYLKAIELRPEDTQAFYGLSQNMRFSDETAEVRQMLDRYASGDLQKREQEYVCFALAKVYADLGQHDRAMHFCLEGNWLARRPYDADGARRNLAALRQMVKDKAFAGMPASAAKPGPRPVFIVGMPRSGTTLIETIFSRHPQVLAGGEMQHIPQVEQTLLGWAQQQKGFAGGPYEMLARVPADLYSRNADAVLSRVDKLAGARQYGVFTDKLPENSLRVGLISLLFPNARIIHMRRHPLDCCLSILFLHFTRGNGYTFQQSLLGERYRQVGETMELWRQGLDLPILDLSYEALVSDPEPEIRRALAFAGLDWDPACLTPERSDRSVGTANQFQVRQPINTASVGRWRRYEDWLRPLIASLGGMAWIDKEAEALERLAASPHG